MGTGLGRSPGSGRPAEGTFEVRCTLGVDPANPVGFRGIRLSFELTSTAEPVELDCPIDTTERYCVVLQAIHRSTPVEIVRVRVTPRTARFGCSRCTEFGSWIRERMCSCRLIG